MLKILCKIIDSKRKQSILSISERIFIQNFLSMLKSFEKKSIDINNKLSIYCIQYASIDSSDCDMIPELLQAVHLSVYASANCGRPARCRLLPLNPPPPPSRLWQLSLSLIKYQRRYKYSGSPIIYATWMEPIRDAAAAGALLKDFVYQRQPQRHSQRLRRKRSMATQWANFWPI